MAGSVPIATALALLAACGGEDPSDADAATDGAVRDGGPADGEQGAADAGVSPAWPRELADGESLDWLGHWDWLPVLRGARYEQQSSHDRGVAPATDLTILHNGNRDLNHFQCAGGTVDRQLPQAVAIVLDAPMCNEEHLRGYVMARFMGSGWLTRLWMTALSMRTGTTDREVVRIYVDGETDPQVVVPLSVLATGSADVGGASGLDAAVFAPPFGAGREIQVAWYYPVAFSSEIIVTMDGVGLLDGYYYEAAAVLDDVPRERPVARDAALSARRDRAADLLTGTEPPLDAAANHLEVPFAIAPGTEEEVQRLAGAQTIQRLAVVLPSESLDRLGDLTIELTFDDRDPPNVHLPLPLLFAAALEPATLGSLALGVHEEGGMTELRLSLPMPMRESAIVRIANDGATAVAAILRIDTVSALPPEPFGLLHVASHETIGPASATHHPLIDATGPGRLVGVCMLMEGHGSPRLGLSESGLNFLEGDARAIIDGETRLQGTGTEDYFNSAFYFEDGAAATPFAQHWGVSVDATASPPSGRASACRWHVLTDAIDFDEDIAMDLEIGPGESGLLDRYQSVAFHYR